METDSLNNTNLEEKAEKNNISVNKKKRSFNKARSVIVILSLIIIGLILFFMQRAEHLNYIEAGTQFFKIFRIRTIEKTVIFAVNFIWIYIMMFIITKNMQRNLKELFLDEKRDFPNLPAKSISFVIALVISLIAQFIFAGDFLKLFNTAWFGKKDSILSLDYSYYIVIVPIIRKVLFYFLAISVINIIYVVAYDILTINIKLGGIDLSRLKNSKLSKQIYRLISVIIFVVSILIFTLLPNLFVGDMLKTTGKESFYITGASFTDIYVKFIGFAILPFLLIFSFFKIKKSIKTKNVNSTIKSILIVPVYIVIMYILILIIQVLFLNRNVIENEGQYIKRNISETYTAYAIKPEEKIIEKSEILSSETVLSNQDIIGSIPIIPEKMVVQTLNEQDTHLKIYKYNNAQLIQNYDENNNIAYFVPREVSSNKTAGGATDYTHGNYGIVVSGTKVDDKGSIKYLDREFEDQVFQGTNIIEPRIYYGMETNVPIMTHTKAGGEYDYPLTSSKVKQNIYDGAGGLNLKFLDRLVLGIKTSSPNIIINSKIQEETKILFNRNIIKRAESILPEVRYDTEPYLIISDEGRLLWVVDGYTISKNYPYSQKILLPTNDGRLKKVNYIRNSVKVIIDAYDGNMDFYIDKTDPMILSIDYAFNNVFKSMEDIPKNLVKKFRYPKFLYDVQSEVIRKYHTNAIDIFYGGEDVWEFSLLENESNKIGKKRINHTIFKNFNEDKLNIGYLTIYTPYGRQNINAYLVGVYENSQPKLKLYEYSRNEKIPGIEFIKTQIMSETLIKEELEELNVIGTEIKSYPMLIPVENSMLYVEPVYQVYINKNNHAILKKVIIANGSKVGIGNNINSAITNLFSDLAINIDIHDPLDRELIIEAIIRTNNYLEKAMSSKNLQDIGKHTQELSSLIQQLKLLTEEMEKKLETEKVVIKDKKQIEDNNTTNDLIEIVEETSKEI